MNQESGTIGMSSEWFFIVLELEWAEWRWHERKVTVGETKNYEGREREREREAYWARRRILISLNWEWWWMRRKRKGMRDKARNHLRVSRQEEDFPEAFVISHLKSTHQTQLTNQAPKRPLKKKTPLVSITWKSERHTQHTHTLQKKSMRAISTSS